MDTTIILMVAALISIVIIWFLWASTSDYCAYSLSIIIPLAFLVAAIANYPITPLDLSELDIAYKSIGVENSRYYAIEKDGDIFTITQEQWAELDVPVIAETK